MGWTAFGIFLVAALVVAAAPGPTVLQIFAQAMTGNPRRPASLIAGAMLANVLMVLASILGLSALLIASQSAFTALKWVGSAYLIYLGLYYWRLRAEPLNASIPDTVTYKRLFAQAVLTSLTNPKGLVFYITFLPQFVTPDADPHSQLAILGATYIGICLVTDVCYALAGTALSGLAMSARAIRVKNRLTGSVLIGVGLSMLRLERSSLSL